MSMPITAGPYHLAAHDWPALWHLGALITFKATSDNTDGRLWVQEAMGQRGYASPLHRHSQEDEAFYVLDGELSVYVGNDVIRAKSGSFLWAPRDIWKGTDGNLWEAQGKPDQPLDGPFNRSMGPLGSAPTVAIDRSGAT